MQAIITKYLPANRTRGSRIAARCAAGSVTIDYPHELSGEAVHIAAADALCNKLVGKGCGAHWLGPRVCGGLPDGTYAHVFLD